MQRVIMASICLVAILVISSLSSGMDLSLMLNNEQSKAQIRDISGPIPFLSNEYNRLNFDGLPGIFVRTGNIGLLHISIKPRGVTRQTREWTFMVYLDAANNLEPYGIEDFLEMSSVGSSSEVAIIVLMDRIAGYDSSYDDWTDTRIFYVDPGEGPNATNADEIWGEKNMGDPQTLVDFVAWCISNYPANHYALILWDHGGGLSGVCWDDDDGGDNINLYELRNALETIYNNLGIVIDIIGFDACLMGMIEVAYQCRNYVNYVVFSQETEGADGWPYGDILGPLVANPTMSPADFAVLIAQKYVESYNGGSQGTDTSATQSAINMSALTTVTFRKLDRLVGELIRNYDSLSTAISNAVSGAEAFYYDEEKDLIHFLELLKGEVSDPNLISLIDETIDSVNASIMYGGHLSGHPNAYGLSAYFPSGYYDDYDGVLMSIHHQWDEFTKKRTGNSVDLWFYDIAFTGSDSDNNGYYDSGVIYVDLDSDTAFDLFVRVYGYDGVDEYPMGESSIVTVSGNVSSDVVTIDLEMPPYSGIFTMRFEVCNSSGSVIKQLYYYCDDDVSDLPLEYLPGYPKVRIVAPVPNTPVYNTVLLRVNASDEDGISWVKVKIGDTWYSMTYNATSGYFEYLWNTTLHDDGWFQIIVNASDTGGNITSTSAKYLIDNIIISILSPKNGDRIRNRTQVVVNVTLRTSIVSIDRVTMQLRNYTFNGSLIQLQYNVTSGYYEGEINTTEYSDGVYEIYVFANHTNGGRDRTKISVYIDNVIAPILIVDDDGGDSYEEYYIQALEDIGFIRDKDFELWSVIADGQVTSDTLYGRSVVIWFTGDDYSSTLTTNDRTVLAEYLDNGGSLFISGQDIGYDIYDEDAIWYETYLKAIYEADDTDVDNVVGLEGTIFEGVQYYLTGGDGASNNNYPSDIAPTGGSILSLCYGGDTNLGAAVTYDGTYRLVYFAFPFEAINSATDRSECMLKILAFLMGVGGYPSVEFMEPENGDVLTGEITVRVNATDEDGYITMVSLYVDDIYYCNMTYNASDGYWYAELNASTLAFGEHKLTARATDNDGLIAVATIIIYTKQTSTYILIVDDDGGANYETLYIESLENLGFVIGQDFDVWCYSTEGELSAKLLLEYTVVIWFTGDDYSSTLLSSDREALAQYLDAGGSLFISGQDIGFDIYYEDTTWYETYLKAIYEADDTDVDNVVGLEGTIFEGVQYYLTGGDGASNNNYPSDIAPTGGSTLALCYGGDSSLGAAVVYDGTYRLVYFAFPFEAINKADDRKECMGIVLGFLIIGYPLEPPEVLDYAPHELYLEVPSGTELYFEISVDKIANITWLVNGTVMRDDMNVNASFLEAILDPGLWNITVVASNRYGYTSISWTIRICIPLEIVEFYPTQHDIRVPENTSVIFRVEFNQKANITWYINSSEAMTVDQTRFSEFNTTLGFGTWNITVVGINENGSEYKSWIVLVYKQLEILEYSPEQLSIETMEDTEVTFQVRFNQPVDAIWYINGTVKRVDENIIITNLTTTFEAGIWNITIVGSNENGSASISWIVKVSSKGHQIPTFIFALALVLVAAIIISVLLITHRRKEYEGIE